MPRREAGLERLARKFQKELHAGAVALLLLSILERAGEPLYGYEVARRLEDLAEGSPRIKHGTLYPALRAMERDGILKSRTRPSVSGPPRRYYALTPAGRKVLAVWKETWRGTRDLVDRGLEGASGDRRRRKLS